MRKKNKMGDIWHWFIGSFSALSVFSLLKVIASWAWNKLPAVQRLKKDQEVYSKLRKAEADHLARLKALIDEIEEGCIQETLACLKDMRVTSDLATQPVLTSLHQRLSNVIRHINNEAAAMQTSHNRIVGRLIQEDE
jgi:hypothetical protein